MKQKKSAIKTTNTEYIIGDARYHRVTSITGRFDTDLQMMLKLRKDSMENAAKAGTLLHKTIDLMWDKKLTPVKLAALSSKDITVFEKFELYRLWAVENIDCSIASEVTVKSDEIKVAGTVDLIAHMVNGETAVLDWKSGQPSWWHKVQVSTYWKLANKEGYKAKKAYIVYIGEKITVEIIDNPEHYYSCFLHALCLYNALNK